MSEYTRQDRAELEYAHEIAAIAKEIWAGTHPVYPMEDLIEELGFDSEELRAEGRVALAEHLAGASSPNCG